MPSVISLITKYQLEPFEPTPHVYVSVGASNAFSVMLNVSEKKVTGIVGEGHDTKGSVGTSEQEVLHVKLASVYVREDTVPDG